MRGVSLAILLLFACSLHAEAPLGRFGSQARYDYLPFNFKVIDWNIYKGGKSGLAQDFAHLSRNADVAVFQEAYEAPELVRDISAANQEFEWTIVRNFKSSGYYTGVATGSRVKAWRVEGFFTEVTEPITNTPKTMLLTEYAISNSPLKLTVLNVHAINFVMTYVFRQQVRQIVEIIKNSQGPVIVVGDFNTWTAGRRTFLDQSLAALGLHKLALENRDASSLDHAFVRGLHATEAKFVTGIRSSDHPPMVLQLQPSVQIISRVQ